jgi:integral membrane sensor domain MASE1
MGGELQLEFPTMKFLQFLSDRHQFRLILCGHKVAEAGVACLLLMIQGQITDVTMAHLLIASKTGLLAVLPVLVITFTHYAEHLLNRWASSLILGLCTFTADAVIHSSHYPGQYTEAALTGVGAFVFSILISLTPIGRRIDGLAEALRPRHPAALRS